MIWTGKEFQLTMALYMTVFCPIFDLHLGNKINIDSYIHERGVDVVGALPVDGDEEGEAAVWRKDVHAAVLLVVPGQQGDAAVLHPQRGRHHVQSLSGMKKNHTHRQTSAGR